MDDEGGSDPLSRLSDLAPDSSCSSWSGSAPGSPRVPPRGPMTSGSSPGSPRVPPRRHRPLPPSEGEEEEEEDVDWQDRCVQLQLELHRCRHQATRAREMLKQKLSELELRVVQAESRAEEAECKVRIMEQQLGQAGGGVPGEGGDPHNAISTLASQVEEQRQLRLQDAKQVEAKAARIKEWVTNKLRELEAQNQHLREQNHKCNQQLELLRRHMAQLSAERSVANLSTAANQASVANLSASEPRPSSLLRANSTGSTRGLLEVEPVYAEVDRRNGGASAQNGGNGGEPPKSCTGATGSTVLGHRRHLSACAGTMTSPSQQLSEDLQAAVDGLALLPVHIRPKSDCVETDSWHDYAEIYTPSREKNAPNWEVLPPKPPTPPLHRFPSWESRIYQVANEGLATSTLQTDSTNNNHNPPSQGYCDISVPVYATVKGRASQIRSMPFTEDSSDDSSDGEAEHTSNAMNHSGTRATNSSSDNTDTSLSSSSPSKSQKTTSSLSPAKRSSSGSPSKNTSFESGMSDDYAIPPDAVSCESIEWSMVLRQTESPSRVPRINESLEKSGHLAKLGGKLKTWRRRWFLLSNAKLRYWKSQNDMNRKPQGEISIDEQCRIVRADGAATFEIATGKKTYYLTADSISAMEDWVRVLQNVQRRNATKLLLSKEHNKPTLQGWLTKVRNGHAKKCWCVLLGKMFLYFKTPSDNSPVGQINMRDARVEQVDHVSDSDSEDNGGENAQLTIGIFPTHQGPTYLLMPSKQDKDSWLYHLTVVSGAGGLVVGTQYEQLVQKLMESDGDPGCVLWRHPHLLHTKDTISAPLTTLSSESLQAEAIKLFKCCQLFISVAVESAGIDYHVVLAQNALQQCLDQWELQAELLCALVKQTSRHTQSKLGVQVFCKLRHRQLLLCATQSLFACDAAAAGSPTVGVAPPTTGGGASGGGGGGGGVASSLLDHCKANPPQFAFFQGWQLLALAVSLFVPKNNKLLWYLKLHLQRNSDSKSDCGKYAAYCERALERTIQNGGREVKPSRMEVLSILLKNPYHHSLPHSIPVHLLNGTYQVVGFDGSTTIEEFLSTLNQEIGCRESASSGFMLFSDDPIEKDLEHYIEPAAKLCDVISKWETALREKGSGKFENTRVIQLIYKNRLYWRHAAKMETDRERLLLCYQVNQQVVNGRFPVNRDLALELTALMAQIDFGDYNVEKGRGSGGSSRDLQVLQALDKFYPYRYRDNLAPDTLKELKAGLQEKWISLKGRSPLDCVRIYLTCTRKWPFFGASLFQAKWKQAGSEGSGSVVWMAVGEDSVTLLELGGMQPLARHPYSSVLTFGGCQDDLMLVVSANEGLGSQKLLFSLSKPKILEVTLLIADYMNALGRGGTPLAGTLTRTAQPDILKATPDQHQQLTRSDSKKRTESS